MRSRLLLIALALTVTACDSAEPGDELLGTWTLTGLDTDLLVTSRTAQTLPDLTATPEGAVEVSGAVTTQLRYLQYTYGYQDSRTLVLGSRERYEGTGTFTELYMNQSANGADVSLYHTTDTSQFSFSEFESAAAFSFDGGRLSVPSRTLSNGAESVTVSGGLTFPTTALAAGEPTTVPYGEDDFEEVDDTITFTFSNDGAFKTSTIESNRTETLTGTWELVGDTQDEVRIGIQDGSVTQFITFGFEVRGGELLLTTPLYEDGCDADCLASFESTLLAVPGSLAAAELTLVYRLREGGPEARARVLTAPTPWDVPRPPREGPARPILDRLR